MSALTCTSSCTATPTTRPARNASRPAHTGARYESHRLNPRTEENPIMRIWTLNHVADWEGGVTVYQSHAALWQQIQADAEEAAENSGERLPNDPEDWPSFIVEYGWKVDRYDWEMHDLDPAYQSDAVFDMTPRRNILCGACDAAIRHTYGDPVDSWTDDAGNYPCPASPGNDHRPK